MTDYETKSLEIAQNTLYVYLGADLIALLTLIAAIVGGFIAFRTLRNIEQQLESAKWNVLLPFEQDMNTRRQHFSDMAQKLIVDPAKYEASYQEAKERYLNSVERLASAILNGQFPETEMKISYREYIISTIREYPDKFVAGTRYPRILKLYEKWLD
jgi:hypothetical protein